MPEEGGIKNKADTKGNQEFMNIVAGECAVKKHHPEWSNVSYLYIVVHD
jgi:4a-hydroxytetrahydrobiopterin dehydratase